MELDGRGIFDSPPSDQKPFVEVVREGLRDAVFREGRNPFNLIREVVELQRKPNQLSVRNYFEYRLYRRGLDRRNLNTYLGKAGAEELHARMISPEHVATARDKVIFHQIMSAEGLPVPRIVALYHPYRGLSSAVNLRSPDAVEEFLFTTSEFPLFTKPARERQSLAAQLWTDADSSARELVSHDGRVVGVDRFLEAIRDFDVSGYLFQERLRPDDRLEEICGPTVSTVRLMVVLDDSSPHLFRASWKVPVAANLADNFWRPGNMLASIDPDSGEVLRVVAGLGADQVSFDRHPDTDASLTGRMLPDWDELSALALAGARAFPGIGVQGWDVALTDRGPVAVEMNYGGDPMLVQLPHDVGIFDDSLRQIVSRRHDPIAAASWLE